MRRALSTLAIAAGIFLAFVPNAIAAEEEWDKYKIESASVALSDTQAGAHADFTTNISLSRNGNATFANTRDVVVRLPTGLAGNPEAFPKCTANDFGSTPKANHCPLDSQVGSAEIVVGGLISVTAQEPVYNMTVPGGDIVARFGFYGLVFPIFVNVRLDPKTNTLVAATEGTSAAAQLLSTSFTLWGVPGDPIHDPLRWTPKEAETGKGPLGGRPSNQGERPFMVNPTSCEANRQVTISARSYQLPDSPSTLTVPFPQITGCDSLEFNPEVTLKPTTTQGTSGSGLDYELLFPTKGLQFGNLTYGSELRRAEVTLPAGMTVNPSEAEGLGVCSPADFERETYNSGPNVGCPESSKIGSVEAITPVIDRNAAGALYLAKPYDNPFGSLLALYMVLKVPDRGILVKLAGRVTVDPGTGQITTVFDDVPQLPVGEFRLHFREGSRAPLVTPPTCGSHSAISNLTPQSKPASVLSLSSSFAIDSGPDRGRCPTGGLPPFHPELQAYSVNLAAGAFSPFYIGLSRKDSEQEITHFSIKLPPGEVGKLAGIPFCSDAAIEAAKARKGPHGGEEELVAPSCPAASEIGTSWGGAGVGGTLVYVPGKVYLAGPYHGSALSIVAITAAKAGPFDLGTVVIREALSINPETAEVFVDATGSDPIPHIVAGIPVRLRDIRVSIDRSQFALNPTDCTRTSTASTILGAGLDFVSEADDRPITVTSPFQVADCAALPFKPKISFKLKGGTRRGAHPAFIARLKGQGLGASGIARTQVTLPRSEFIENAHFNTICTRVQFKAAKVPGAGCPAGSIYGKASAVTPLLDEPVTGQVYLRSSEHQLPDLVVALHSGKIDVVLVGRVDSVDGQLRTTFESVPDAPVTSFLLQMQGGKKGLFVNSTNLCKGTHKALVEFNGQNGKKLNTSPELKANCAKSKKQKRPSHGKR